MDAYLAGLEAARSRHDISRIHSVASFSCPGWTRRSTNGWKRLAPIRGSWASRARPVSPTRDQPTQPMKRCSGAAACVSPRRALQVQRPLWASTGVQRIRGIPTRFTSAEPAAQHGRHHAGEDARCGGRPQPDHRRHHQRHAGAAQEVFDKLAAIGIDLPDVFIVLEDERCRQVRKVVAGTSGRNQVQLDSAEEIPMTNKLCPGVSAPVPAGWHTCLSTSATKRIPRIAGPCGMVIFGVTGDLSVKAHARRSTISPTADCYPVVLVGRVLPGAIGADEDFSQIVHDAVREYARTPSVRRFGTGCPKDSVSYKALSTTTPLSRRWRRHSRIWTSSGVPAVITRSICRFRPRRFRWCVSS